jgi:hypothetical protein
MGGREQQWGATHNRRPSAGRRTGRCCSDSSTVQSSSRLGSAPSAGSWEASAGEQPMGCCGGDAMDRVYRQRGGGTGRNDHRVRERSL